jgi:hypothetical protein
MIKLNAISVLISIALVTQNRYAFCLINKGMKGISQRNDKISGEWCYKVRDSIDFNLHLEIRNDSMFCNYVNVLYNGRYLNAPTNDSDWAFSLPTLVFDTLKAIPIQNYYYGSLVHLNLRYVKERGVLIWKLEEDDPSQTWILPINMILTRCEAPPSR